jgi:hypothetical protein
MVVAFSMFVRALRLQIAVGLVCIIAFVEKYLFLHMFVMHIHSIHPLYRFHNNRMINYDDKNRMFVEEVRRRIYSYEHYNFYI